VAVIRLASQDDAAEVARLMIAFRNWWGRDEPGDDVFEAGVARLLADPNTDYLLAGDPAVGVCGLRYRFAVWTGTEDCCLEDLFVDPEARRSGLGRALVEAAFERARERGCARMELDANEANPAAVGLYRSLGFESWSDPPGGNNLLMRRRL
jgi:ribosomal protein S18 acetylase RimI-like enzyme